jgi:ankyrin repeat protein
MASTEFDEFQRLVKKGDLAGLRFLIRRGWNVNPTEYEGWRTPLLWVHGNTAFIRTLLDAGANVNPVVIHGLSPLACAAQEGHPNAVRLLLRAGASVNVEPYGCSLLTYVMTGPGRNHPKIFEMLRAAGATEFHGNLHRQPYPAGFGPVA